jgi:acyl-CoA thioesterase FadM
MYLVEEGVLEHFRRLDLNPRRLYDDYRLCLEFVYSGVRINRALHLDDVAIVEVTPDKDAKDRSLTFHIRMFAGEAHPRSKILSGQVDVLLRQEPGSPRGHDLPELVRPHVVDAIGPTSRVDQAPVASDVLAAHRHDRLLPDGGAGLIWKRQIPYFYSHFAERLQLSGYLRLVEEAVAIFLARRGMSIRTNLQERNWIPFVSEATIAIGGEVVMEDTVYTALSISRIYKALTYTARLDFYASRGGSLLHTATGTITHGYGLATKELTMVAMDEQALAALRAPVVHYEV